MITIVQAEDHHLVRAALKYILLTQPDFEIVGEASDGLAAVELVQKHKPHILLLDLGLPQLPGIEVLRRIRTQEETKTIVVTIHAATSFVLEALEAGAYGYLLKEASGEELIESIRTVARGEYFINSLVRDIAVDTSRRKLSKFRLEHALTDRERLVLEMCALGNTSNQVAEKLGVGLRTIESQRSSFMKKLALKTQTDLVRYAIRNKIIPA